MHVLEYSIKQEAVVCLYLRVYPSIIYLHVNPYLHADIQCYLGKRLGNQAGRHSTHYHTVLAYYRTSIHAIVVSSTWCSS